MAIGICINGQVLFYQHEFFAFECSNGYTFRGVPVSVAEYMEEVLTNPKAGFYINGDVFGAEGDFITSSEVSQMFGEIVGVWAMCLWEQMKQPNRVNLVELGPSRGTLMFDLLLPPVIIAHEFYDALPVHQFQPTPATLFPVKRCKWAAAEEQEKLEHIEAIRKHKFINIFDNPGTADLSAYVDFSSVRHSAEEASGAEPCHLENVSVHGPITQSQFLGSHGINFRVKALLQNCTEEQAESLRMGYWCLVGDSEAPFWEGPDDHLLEWVPGVIIKLWMLKGEAAMEEVVLHTFKAFISEIGRAIFTIAERILSVIKYILFHVGDILPHSPSSWKFTLYVLSQVGNVVSQVGALPVKPQEVQPHELSHITPSAKRKPKAIALVAKPLHRALGLKGDHESS
ncbi:hypothetical protein Pint_19312 [Pistacia integerrima]|uniref:Uncharacterized protein n=1 Tax=Pistacia integerrima TaxID=434235 RepID=A0ACC0YTU2_9ROSI|nr:hypothetical protein Pint_19312 [Pistacia integerrima]